MAAAAAQDSGWSTGSLSCGESTVSCSIRPYVLKTRSVFGTSHSSTAERCNALVTLQLGSHTGYGEVGLPPVKPGVYEASYGDCVALTAAFWRRAEAILGPGGGAGTGVDSFDPFAGLAAADFAPARRLFAEKPRSPFRLLFLALHTASTTAKPTAQRAAFSGIEAAILDCLGKSLGLPLYRLVGLEPASAPGFYTAALSTVEDMTTSMAFGADFTSFLKIKLDSDVARGKEALGELARRCSTHHAKSWSIDANASWTPEIALALLREAIPLAAGRLYMVEQPFPVGALDDAARAQWAEVKAAFNAQGIRIYADESMHTAADLESLDGLVDGVNIKLEKAGGIRGALRAAHEASRRGLSLWLGVMVGSTLNSSTTSHLIPLASHADLDGSLLVTPETDLFAGGFTWGSSNADPPVRGYIVLPADPGLGVALKASPAQ